MSWRTYGTLITLFGLICIAIWFYKSVPYLYNSAKEGLISTKISKPTLGSPICKKVQREGVCWTIDPPKFNTCPTLPTESASLMMKNDEVFLYVPATAEKGVPTIGTSGRLDLKKGDRFEIQADGMVTFPGNAPCVSPEGIYGWYDPFVDSPFSQNVGGLEFAFNSFDSKHYFAGKYYQGVAEENGFLTFRMINRLGTHKNSSGGYTVIVRRLKQE